MTLSVVFSVAPGLLNALLVSWFLLKNPPEFLDEKIFKIWKKIAILSGTVAAFFSLLAQLIWNSSNNLLIQIIVGLAGSALAAVLVVSIFTDFSFRKVDRRFMRLEILVMAIPGIFYMFTVPAVDVIIFAVFVMFGAIFIFLPAMGAGDGRAILLGVLSICPGAGFKGILYSLILLALLNVVYGIVYVVRNKKGINFKVSMPAVPFISASFLTVLLIFPLLAI